VNASIRTKLERLVDRFGEVTALLADAQVQANQDQFRDLGREYAQLEPVAECFGRYLGLDEEIAAAQGLLGDPEMADLARDEVGRGSSATRRWPIWPVTRSPTRSDAGTTWSRNCNAC
jgi:peptide chain release factor 1